MAQKPIFSRIFAVSILSGQDELRLRTCHVNRNNQSPEMSWILVIKIHLDTLNTNPESQNAVKQIRGG